MTHLNCDQNCLALAQKLSLSLKPTNSLGVEHGGIFFESVVVVDVFVEGQPAVNANDAVLCHSDLQKERSASLGPSLCPSSDSLTPPTHLLAHQHTYCNFQTLRQYFSLSNLTPSPYS